MPYRVQGQLYVVSGRVIIVNNNVCVSRANSSKSSIILIAVNVYGLIGGVH